MGKRLAQLAVLIFGITSCLVISASALSENPNIRVGLYYGSSALASANLENNTGYGSGYRFGFFDNSYNFTQVGSTTQTQISMLKNSNIYLSGGTYYTSAPSGTYSTVGAYHIQLSGTYASYSAAASAASAYSGGFPAYINGSYRVRVGSYTSSSNASSAMSGLGISSGTVVGNSSTAITITRTGTTTILFQFDYSGNSSLVVKPGQNDSVKTRTWFKGYRYYGCFQYKRLVSNGNLTVINILPMEDYVKGVLPYEMNSAWPLEALKAQAVCARSYAGNAFQKHSSAGFDICNTTDCQVYRGLNSASDNSDKAVDETYDVYAWYGSSLVQAVYHSCDGGATENVKNIWGTNYAYLTGVIDPYEADIAGSISYYNWSVTYTPAELTARLKERGYSCSTITNVYVASVSETGNPTKVTFVDSAGKSYSFSLTSLVSIFNTAGKNLRSYRYTITPNGSSTGSTGGTYYVNPDGSTISSADGAYVIGGDGTTSQITSGNSWVITSDGTSQLTTQGSGTVTNATSFTVSGSGWGHNVGMSQWGAYAMAKRGYTYDQILKFYYTGIALG